MSELQQYCFYVLYTICYNMLTHVSQTQATASLQVVMLILYVTESITKTFHNDHYQQNNNNYSSLYIL